MSHNLVKEKELELRVMESVDCIIYGANLKGCTVALSAAQNGKKVLLIERLAHPTGTFLFASVDVLQMPIDNNSLLMDVPGIAGRFVKKMIQMEGLKYSINSGKMFISVDHEVYKAGMLALLQEAGVELLLHTTLSEVIEKNGNKYIITENKNGRQAYETKSYLCMKTDDVPIPQIGTCIFGIDNVNIDCIKEDVDRCAENNGADLFHGCIDYDTGRSIDVISLHKHQLTYVIAKVNMPDAGKKDPLSRSRAEMYLQKQSILILDELKKKNDGFKDAYVTWFLYDSFGEDIHADAIQSMHSAEQEGLKL